MNIQILLHPTSFDPTGRVQSILPDATVTMKENRILEAVINRPLSLQDLKSLQVLGLISMEVSGAGTTGLVL